MNEMNEMNAMNEMNEIKCLQNHILQKNVCDRENQNRFH